MDCVSLSSEANIHLVKIYMKEQVRSNFMFRVKVNKMTFFKSSATNFRVIHRYLGFFLAGIMTVYALSGMTLIFRDTDFLKQDKQVIKELSPNISTRDLGRILGMRQFKVENEENNLVYFQNGTYDKNTGKAEYVIKELPYVLNQMTHLHKAKSGDPLFFLNVFFGLSLLFFVVSSFWMFAVKTPIFKKGMYFTCGGIVLTLILLFV